MGFQRIFISIDIDQLFVTCSGSDVCLHKTGCHDVNVLSVVARALLCVWVFKHIVKNLLRCCYLLVFFFAWYEIFYI